jgi:phospholipid-binding lipoprotein MlaA
MALARSALDRLAAVACFGGLALALTACSTVSGGRHADAALLVGPPRAVEAVAPFERDGVLDSLPQPSDSEPAAVAVDARAQASPSAPAQASPSAPVAETAALEQGMAQARDESLDTEPEEYDPWERWNEPMFNFNRRLDQYVLKPVAKGYNFVVPDEIQIMISNGFDNISFVPRLVNSLLQGKVKGAGRELGRFLINSTAGVGGLFDPAKDVFGILKSREDFGQTLGFWGVGPGPYLIVPFLEPLTVRDGVGKAVDSALDPLSYFLPLFWDRLGMKIGDIVNERSLNLDLFQGFEESVIDMYSAVRHAYLQRRLRLIRE